MKQGLKRFEFRKDDRGYEVGDVLTLREWDPATEQYTGDDILRIVTYKLDGGKFGLPDGYCIMSVKVVESYSAGSPA